MKTEIIEIGHRDRHRDIPKEVLEAARTLERWATMECGEFSLWQIGGVCSRKFAFEIERRDKILYEFRKKARAWHQDAKNTPGFTPALIAHPYIDMMEQALGQLKWKEKI